MFRRLCSDESGYSLPELIVAMVILTLAIFPMIGMFESGLKASSTGSNLDKARTLANKQLERAKSLPYADARDKFPGTANSIGASGKAEVKGQKDPAPEYSDFSYDVIKEYVELKAPASGGSDMMEFARSSDGTDKGMLRVTITVKWGNGNDYSTTGVVGG